MIYTIPFKVWSGQWPDVDNVHGFVVARKSYIDPGGYQRWAWVRGLCVRGFDRQMPDVPPSGGPGDVNMLCTLGEAYFDVTDGYWPSGHAIPDSAALSETRGRRLEHLLRFIDDFGDNTVGYSVTWTIGFNARKGFSKRWDRGNAPRIGINGLCVICRPRSLLSGDHGLVLCGTVELEVHD